MKKQVLAVHINPEHTFSKTPVQEVQLLAGLGVAGDAHCGQTTQHLYAQRKNPTAPNLRQVHLIHQELFEELSLQGFSVQPGQLGENITTQGIDLLTLPRGTRLILGDTAEIELTGLRTPCSQINDFQPGLMNALMYRNENHEVIRKSGVMAIILNGGVVRSGDMIKIILPDGPHQPLEPV
jgi:MOSC domain-containing protein YiiM